VAKSKKKSRKQIEKEGRKLIIETRKEARLDALNDLKQMVEDGISFETAVNELIADVTGAKVPVNKFPTVSEINDTVAGENVWVPKVEDTSQEQAYLGVGDLADVVGVHKESVYKFLRKNFPDSRPAPGHTWFLTIEMRDAVLENWTN
jgi:predicted transcriptional regulator